MKQVMYFSYSFFLRFTLCPNRLIKPNSPKLIDLVWFGFNIVLGRFGLEFTQTDQVGFGFDFELYSKPTQLETCLAL